jgi:hypothetical protein
MALLTMVVMATVPVVLIPLALIIANLTYCPGPSQTPGLLV